MKIYLDTVNEFKSLHIQKDTPLALVLFLVKVGTRYETSDVSGIAHFIEHMMFKQTQKRSTSDIAIEIESLGSQTNAFTSHQYTGFFIKMLGTKFDESFEILADIFQNGKFDKNDLDIERGNIIEEIKLTQDTPSDLVWDYAQSNIFPNNTLGWPILGTEDSVNKINQGDILKFLEQKYLQDDILIVSVGDFDHDRVKDNITKHLRPRKPGRLEFEPAEFKPKSKINFHHKESCNQAHVVISFPGVKDTDEDFFKYEILAEILGGGMGSILFLLLREQLGVAYYVGALHPSYQDVGTLQIYFGTNTDKTSMVIQEVFKTLEDIKTKGVSKRDLERAQNYYFSQITMAQENILFLGRHYGLDYLLHGKIDTIEDIKRKIYSITEDDIKNLAKKVFSDHFNITYIANSDLIKI
ncbi:MAG: peptidase M16 [Candidatus Dojkabacteria bacterium]|nr:MAG: peptidase M16 [Candidatus Dojkabacteria bacterium]